MAAETNTIMQADLAKVRTVDFNYQFTGNLNKLIEALGVTRKIAVQEGATLKALKVVGTLEDGAVKLIKGALHSHADIGQGSAEGAVHLADGQQQVLIIADIGSITNAGRNIKITIFEIFINFF